MTVPICEACGKPIPDGAAVCPYCGAKQQEGIRLTKIPETIRELQDFCAAHHMPLQKMRFFIGEDYRGARAFGIYKDEHGDCVVYKNKADGSRAIRYRGPDERRAVRELYDKLKSETELRRSASRASSPPRAASEKTGAPNRQTPRFNYALLALVVLAAAVAIHHTAKKPNRGYYRYRDDTYYYQRGWYRYNILENDWESFYDVPEELLRDHDSYFDGRRYSDTDVEDYGVTDFRDSDCYETVWDQFFDSDSSYDDYDWDDDSDDWDWDDWDSSDTDWDSDW